MIKTAGVQFQTGKIIFLYTECKNESHISFQIVVNYWNVEVSKVEEVLKADSISRFRKVKKNPEQQIHNQIQVSNSKECILFHL